MVRSKIKKALKKSEQEDADEAEIDAVEEVVDEIEQEFALNPVLIAEVPKSGDRWQQVNFDLKSYQEYFGVTKGSTKHLRFHQVHDDGSLGEPENRQMSPLKARTTGLRLEPLMGCRTLQKAIPYSYSKRPLRMSSTMSF